MFKKGLKDVFLMSFWWQNSDGFLRFGFTFFHEKSVNYISKLKKHGRLVIDMHDIQEDPFMIYSTERAENPLAGVSII